MEVAPDVESTVVAPDAEGLEAIPVEGFEVGVAMQHVEELLVDAVEDTAAPQGGPQPGKERQALEVQPQMGLHAAQQVEGFQEVLRAREEQFVVQVLVASPEAPTLRWADMEDRETALEVHVGEAVAHAGTLELVKVRLGRLVLQGLIEPAAVTALGMGQLAAVMAALADLAARATAAAAEQPGQRRPASDAQVAAICGVVPQEVRADVAPDRRGFWAEVAALQATQALCGVVPTAQASAGVLAACEQAESVLELMQGHELTRCADAQRRWQLRAASRTTKRGSGRR